MTKTDPVATVYECSVTIKFIHQMFTVQYKIASMYTTMIWILSSTVSVRFFDFLGQNNFTNFYHRFWSIICWLLIKWVNICYFLPKKKSHVSQIMPGLHLFPGCEKQSLKPGLTATRDEEIKMENKTTSPYLTWTNHKTIALCFARIKARAHRWMDSIHILFSPM